MFGRDGGRSRNFGPPGGGRGRGRMAAGMRPVSEGTRIDIAAALEEFQASDAKQYAFPPGLSNHDRAVVHAECKKYGFSSKSFGKGEGRAVTVFKPKGTRKATDTFELPLGEATLTHLSSYFAEFPPTEAELALAAGCEIDGGEKDNNESNKSNKSNNACLDLGSNSKAETADEDNAAPGNNDQEVRDIKSNRSGRKQPRDGRVKRHAAEFDPDEIARRRGLWEQRLQAPSMAEITAARQSLPIASHKEAIVATVRDHQVILVAGETGCGKTTQVPQYLLEDSWQRGQGCRIICTQPRRISAVSIADRVACERGEQQAGESVGYTIRLDSRGGSESSLMFCTNGVLLRMMTGSDDVLKRTTHVIIDEIHERDRFADFLLILMRRVLPRHPHLRVVLMSATLHIELFSGYFGGCPVITVPGFTHPVQDFYLEDVLRLTGYEAAAVREIAAELGGEPANAASILGLGAGPQSLGQSQGQRRPSPVDHVRSTASRPTPSESAAKMVLSEQDRSRVEIAIERAVRLGQDEDFDALLEVTGAAAADEVGGGAPGVNLRHPGTGVTPLIAAAIRGRDDVAATLLANGADTSIAANNGMTARECAAKFRFVDFVELLDEYDQQTRAADELASSALALSHYQANTDADEVDLELVESLLAYICGEGRFAQAAAEATARRGQQQDHLEGQGQVLGAILVFLPGWDEIVRLKDRLEASPMFGGASSSKSKYLILPLHSLVAPAEQRKVFLRPPQGTRKLVLATNIAETALTIDDVVVVVDSGRLKEKSYDPYTGVSTLQSAWISKASERQRRGRAGRCQPGVAFHMYSRQRSDSLAEFQLPELKRSPLDELALQVQLLIQDKLDMLKKEAPLPSGGGDDVARGGGIASFLAQAVEPPLPQAVTQAVALLQDIGALDDREQMTTLGRHLAALPLPPATGKLLLYGVLFKCLDPVLTVACFMAYRDPWVLPAAADARREAAMVRARLAAEAGGASDHLATVRAFNEWKAARSRGTDRQYCARHFLSPATMVMADGMRGQLLEELKSRGFVDSLEAASERGEQGHLVRAVLACGFYPQIARLLPLPRNDPKAKTAVLTRKGERVRVHPVSVNAKLRIDAPDKDEQDEPQYAALVFYDEITRGDASLYLKSSTAMHPHPAVLVAAHVTPAADEHADAATNATTGIGQGPSPLVVDGIQANDDDALADTNAPPANKTMDVAMQDMQLGDEQITTPETGLLVVDGWLPFRVPFAAIAHLSCLRIRLASAFAETVRRPHAPLPRVLQGALAAATAIFHNESESADGTDAYLGTSFASTSTSFPQGGAYSRSSAAAARYADSRGGEGSFRGRGRGRGHLFNYSHHAPPARRTFIPVPSSFARGGGGAGRGGGRFDGRPPFRGGSRGGRGGEYRGQYQQPARKDAACVLPLPTSSERSEHSRGDEPSPGLGLAPQARQQQQQRGGWPRESSISAYEGGGRNGGRGGRGRGRSVVSQGEGSQGRMPTTADDDGKDAEARSSGHGVKRSHSGAPVEKGGYDSRRGGGRGEGGKGKRGGRGRGRC